MALTPTISIVDPHVYIYEVAKEDKMNSLVPLLAFLDHLQGDMAILAPIFGGAWLWAGRLGADVLKLHQKFRPYNYMGQPPAALTQNWWRL